MTNYEKSKHQPNLHLTMRGKIGALIVAGLAVFGGVKAGENAASTIGSHSSHEFSTEQLNQLPHHEVVLPPGEGINKLITEVDPALMNDGQGLADLQEYISSQVNSASHIPQAGETFSVPVIDLKGPEPAIDPNLGEAPDKK